MSAVGDVLGAVGVVTTKIVKVAMMVGMAATGLMMAAEAIPIVAGANHELSALFEVHTGLGFLASLAGFRLADWVEGGLKSRPNHPMQAQELARLQQMGGLAR